MPVRSPWRPLLAAISACFLAPPARADDTRPNVDFDRQVRPILADKCFACHGPDAEARESGLRLDVRDDGARSPPTRAGAPSCRASPTRAGYSR